MLSTARSLSEYTTETQRELFFFAFDSNHLYTEEAE